ncbi:MAG: hypothetical protein ABFS02_06095, partial [Pseudomonadota bacterium]
MKTKLSVIAGVLGVAVMAYSNAANAELTGCLNKRGKLNRLQQGLTPVKVCKSKQTEVSIPTVDALDNVPTMNLVNVDSYQVVPFSVANSPAADNTPETVGIVTNGDLTVSLRCTRNDGLGNDVAELVFTSAQDGWAGDNSPNLLSTDELVLDQITVVTTVTDVEDTPSATGDSTAAMDSS